MSKMDDMRAMREANYAQPAVRATDPVAEPSGDRLCGHRAISGRTCTREHGHTAKSHRYS